MTAAARTSVLAVVSLVLGIASFFLPVIVSLGAVITGHLARSELRRTPGMSGHGLARAGLITGYLTLAVPCLAIGTIAVFGDDIRRLFVGPAADAGPEKPLREFPPPKR